MGNGFFNKKLIDKYFLESACPYTKRRPFKMKTLYWTGGTLLTVFIVVIMFTGGQPEKKSLNAVPDYSIHGSTINSATALADSNNALVNSKQGNSFGSLASGGLTGIGYGGGSYGSATVGRSHTSNQVIRRGEGGNDPSARIPMGEGIQARLLNAILSTNNATPVIAEVTQDVVAHGTVSIPAGTHVIGQASFDDASRRIQLRFNTFVYPEGDQHGLQGFGLMPDGSAGVSGDYHSGETKRQIGKFLSNFVGGLADGMKERESGGLFGAPYEKGSIKNGLLNGVTLSAQDESKSLSDDLTQTKPFMTLPAGTAFTIFLEKEYMP